MREKSILVYHNLALLIHGLHLDPLKRPWVRLVNSILGVHLLLVCSISIILKLLEIFTVFAFYLIVHLLDFTKVLFLAAYIRANRHKIQTLAETIQHLSRGQCHGKQRLALSLILIYIALVLLDYITGLIYTLTSSTINRYVAIKYHIDQPALLPQPLKVFLFLFRDLCTALVNSFDLLIILLYILFVKILSSIQRQFLSQLNATKLYTESAYREWHAICAAKAELESLLSLSPLVVFMKAFSVITAYLIYFDNTTFQLNMKFALSVMYCVVANTFVLVTLLVVDNASSASGVILHEIQRNLGLKRTDAQKSLLDDIEKNYSFNLSAYGLFKLNKTTIVSYISAIFSFAILFMQLARK